MTEKKLTADEFKKLQQQCKDSGHTVDPSKKFAEDYGDGIVIIDGKMMPAWMAALFGGMADKKPEDKP